MSAAVGGHTSVATTGATATATTPSVTTQVSGSSFFVFVEWAGNGSNTAPVVTDSKGNTYTIVGAAIPGTTAFDTHAALFQCVNGTGGTLHTALVTFTGVTTITAFFVEVTGAATSTPIDQAPAGVLDSASPYTSTLSGTTSQADELLLGFIATEAATGPEVLTWGNSFTQLDSQNDGNTTFPGGSAYRSVTSTGTYQISVTSTGGGTTSAVCFMVSIKSATGGGGPSPPANRRALLGVGT